jgi:hypothetical protein
MVTLETGTLVLLLLAAALAGALLSVLPVWRRVSDDSRHLPVWRFARRSGRSLEGAAALQAELRCALCDKKEQCRLLLATGSETPLSGCPNLELLHKR